METVLLKNGTEEPKPLVKIVVFSLHSLLEENPIELYELVMLCRDSSHVLFGTASGQLRRLKLIQPDGQPHDSVRNVVLSAVVGDGLDMCLTNPQAMEEEKPSQT